MAMPPAGPFLSAPPSSPILFCLHNHSEDNPKPAPSTEAKLSETELKQVSGNYWAINQKIAVATGSSEPSELAFRL